MYDIDNIIDVVCGFINNILDRLDYEDSAMLLDALLTYVDDKQQDLADYEAEWDNGEDEDSTEESSTPVVDANEAELKKQLRDAWMAQHKDLTTSQSE